MTFELIGALFVALTLGLLAWALRRSWPGLPRWIGPVAAGAGLIGTTISLEYTWFDRVSRQLPEGFLVVNEGSDTSPLRPWTYVAPLVTRFVALDGTKAARHPDQKNLLVAPVFGFARWQNPQNSLMVFDCAGNRRVPVTEGMSFNDAGDLIGAEWVVLSAADELQQAACQGG